MQSAPPKIACWGELVWDHFANADETLNGSRVLGGSATALAAQLAAFGAEVRLVSAVGNDSEGQQALEELRWRGVDVSSVCLCNGPTAAVEVRVDPSGEPAYSARTRFNWADPDFERPLSTALDRADALVFGLFAQGTQLDLSSLERVFGEARPRWIACDLNLRRPVSRESLAQVARHAHWVKINQREYELLARSLGGAEPVAWMLAAGQTRGVALTLGALGARLVTRHETFSQPGNTPAGLVDTVGAGDAFMAGLALSLLAGLPEAEALARAVASAEWQLHLRGGLPAPLRVQPAPA